MMRLEGLLKGVNVWGRAQYKLGLPFLKSINIHVAEHFRIKSLHPLLPPTHRYCQENIKTRGEYTMNMEA